MSGARGPRATLFNGALGWSALAAASLAAAGCGETGPEAFVEQRYDSAGVAIVVSGEPEARRVLSDAPLAKIGRVSGDSLYLLEHVSGARLLDDGRIVVANCFPPILRWYDGSGVFLTGTGTEGEGPLEFSRGACARAFEIFALSGGRIETWEHLHRRLRVFDSSGAQIGSQVLAAEPLGSGPRLLGKFDQGYLMAELRGTYIQDFSDAVGDDRGFFVDPRQGNAWRDTLVLHTFGANGEYEGGIGRIMGMPLFRTELPTEIGPMGATVPIPFAPMGDATPWGSRVATGDGSVPEVRVLDRTGQLRMVIRWNAPRIPVTDALIETLIEGQLSRQTGGARARAQLREAMEAYPFPATVRAYTRIRAGNGGLLWVEEYALPGAESVTWLGFAPSGSLVTTLDLPREARLLDIGDGYVLLRVLDELGVESVVLHETEERR
ncbi:MAG: hypothetical protein F4087_09165 [Gemmatimonadetes bacterium]|nr:hypothetical protein [Gemmatimonadota bacterium]MYE71347.1 hypothetical protein [Gemmatimonadota bacterium]MYJ68659.1 hypothetical protein [Gemmatimonadota bacterium]